MSFLMMLLLSGSVHADSYSLDLPDATYSVNPETYFLDYSVHILSNGFALGVRQPKGPPQNYPAKPKQLAVMLQGATKTNIQNAVVLDYSLKQNLKTLRRTTESKTAAVAVVTPVSHDDFDFAACLHDALILLKHKLSLQAALQKGPTPNAQTSLDAVNAELQDKRGAGGLACARGDALLENVVLTQDVEQIKALSALYKRKGAEREQLKQTLAVAYTSGAYGNATTYFRLFWQRLTLAAIFADDALPTWQQVSDDMQAHPDDSQTPVSVLPLLPDSPLQPEFHVRRDLTGLTTAVADGRKYLMENFNVH